MQVFEEAKDLLPGGVNSPVRAFKSVGGGPIVFDRVKGAYCWDVDGNKYIDYVGSWGPAIVGHANDEVNAALVKQIEKGTSFGAPCELEVSPHRIFFICLLQLVSGLYLFTAANMSRCAARLTFCVLRCCRTRWPRWLLIVCPL